MMKKYFEFLAQKFTDTYMSKSKNWIYTQDLEGKKRMPRERAKDYITDIIKRTNRTKIAPKEAASTTHQ